MHQEQENAGSSLAGSQLKARKAALQSKESSFAGASGGAQEKVAHKPIDLPNEEWQKPKASGVVAAVATSVAGIALVVVAAIVLGGM